MRQELAERHAADRAQRRGHAVDGQLRPAHAGQVVDDDGVRRRLEQRDQRAGIGRRAVGLAERERSRRGARVEPGLDHAGAPTDYAADDAIADQRAGAILGQPVLAGEHHGVVGQGAARRRQRRLQRRRLRGDDGELKARRAILEREQRRVLGRHRPLRAVELAHAISVGRDRVRDLGVPDHRRDVVTRSSERGRDDSADSSASDDRDAHVHHLRRQRRLIATPRRRNGDARATTVLAAIGRTGGLRRSWPRSRPGRRRDTSCAPADPTPRAESPSPAPPS